MVNVFLDAYTLTDSTVKKSFERLLQTWKNGMPGGHPVFPRHIIESIERSILYMREKASPHSRYPPHNNTSSSLPHINNNNSNNNNNPNSAIHVNPNFVNKVNSHQLLLCTCNNILFSYRSQELVLEIHVIEVLKLHQKSHLPHPPLYFLSYNLCFLLLKLTYFLPLIPSHKSLIK